MEKIDIAKVLAMSEAEQWEWMMERCSEYGALCPGQLAFRMRDEAMESRPKEYHKAITEILIYVSGNTCKHPESKADVWSLLLAQPIHWILAALKAKEK